MSANKNLTVREKQILQLIARGCTDRDIGKELSISDKTASTHRKHMLKKLSVNNTALLIRYAVEHKLLI